MTQPKKRPRLITVDGVVYRWRIRRRPAMQGPLSFAVERAGRRGTVLIATAPTRLTEWPGAASPPPVPDLVASVIRQARSQGWHPDQPGPAFPLTLDAESQPH